MQLELPRDARHVGMMRKVAQCVMAEVGAPDLAVADMQLALTEACANVVRHAVGSDGYWVAFNVNDDHCEIEVTDHGPGLANAAADGSGGHAGAIDGSGMFSRTPVVSASSLDHESGRGLLLMQALTDDLRFSSDDAGTQVRLIKRWDT